MDSRFCTRCGALLRPDNTCPNCDGTPSPQKGSGFDVKELGMGVFDCAKAFFSKEPHKAVEAVTNSHFMWIVFGVVNVIFSALATSVVFSNGVDWKCRAHVDMDHAAALCDTADRDGLAAEGELNRPFFLYGVGGLCACGNVRQHNHAQRLRQANHGRDVLLGQGFLQRGTDRRRRRDSRYFRLGLMIFP